MAAVYAVLLTLAFIGAAVGAWIATEDVAGKQIRERIQLEMDSLQQEVRIEGMPAAIIAIDTRAESPGALEYRLTDNTQKTVAGHLPLTNPEAGWQEIVLPDPREAGRRDRFIILTQATPGGFLLSIGDDLDRAESVRLVVLSTISWVGALALLLGLAAGAAATLGSLRRMDALSDTMRRVSAGDLAARAPARAAGGDDIDAIGRGVNEMLAQIAALVANVRRVSTDIAHDMRTPLTHVRQELEAAAASENIKDAHDRVRRAQSRIDDVLRIFAAMLRLAEIESGSVRARFAPVDLAAVLERVVDAYRPDVEQSGRTLSTGAFEPITIQGDGDLIAQAVSNLIENAMRHTPPDTAIEVRLERRAGQAVLEVQDRGAGIAEADRERVLKPFERLEASRSSPGAGLGLSIVSAIARLHRARLILKDAQPGLRVTLEWPSN